METNPRKWNDDSRAVAAIIFLMIATAFGNAYVMIGVAVIALMAMLFFDRKRLRQMAIIALLTACIAAVITIAIIRLRH